MANRLAFALEALGPAALENVVCRPSPPGGGWWVVVDTPPSEASVTRLHAVAMLAVVYIPVDCCFFGRREFALVENSSDLLASGGADIADALIPLRRAMSKKTTSNTTTPCKLSLAHTHTHTRTRSPSLFLSLPRLVSQGETARRVIPIVPAHTRVQQGLVSSLVILSLSLALRRRAQTENPVLSSLGLSQTPLAAGRSCCRETAIETWIRGRYARVQGFTYQRQDNGDCF